MPFDTNDTEGLKLPVITLGTMITYPYIPVNFDILREGSLLAFDHADKSDKTVFLAFSKDPDIFTPKPDELLTVGVIAKIEQSISIIDDAVKVMMRGICRATSLGYSEEGGILFASVIPEVYVEPTSSVRDEALRRHIVTKIRELSKLLPPEGRGQMAAAKDISDIGQLADFASYTAFSRYEDKVKILSEFDRAKRALLACAVLENDIEIYKEEILIHQKIQKNLEKIQYENYLREKVKVIREELGDEDDDIEDYIDAIEKTSFSSDKKVSDDIADKLMKEVSRLSKMPFGAPEAVVVKGYLDTCLDLPWDVVTVDTVDVAAAKKILDEDHDGLEKPKERILEYLAVKQLNPSLRNQILCFVGPPGVGKTSLGMSIARAMGRKFARVALGGIHDEAEIRGHRKTYIGSMPGRIIAAIEQAGSRNPVLLLDEIDKMCASVQGDPSSAMLEVLDSEQNKNFRDHYLEVPFDLSDCLFICTANNASEIPPALYDRMEIIELTTYTDNEKFMIAKNHLIPKQMKRHGLTKRMLRLKDDALTAIISGYTKESGVRNLERELSSLFRKAAKKIATGEAKSLTVSAKNIEEYLGPRKYNDEKADQSDLVGVVCGLAYTSVGGDILKIETSVMPGDGKLRLTGTLGDVMKESAEIAVSYIRSHADALKVDGNFYKTRDIHIHVPEGATPKDGPSAGVTMLTSLASSLSGRSVKADIAMTGELTLTGRVLPIGGLKEKTFAAYKAGIKKVIIPKDNLPDLADIDKTVRDKLEFVPVTKASEVLSIALNR
ncbi:MAG: endopeptidase La [Clostridia bacterium]|nr:endopeptidase La [Clostridia bacterium]